MQLIRRYCLCIIARNATHSPEAEVVVHKEAMQLKQVPLLSSLDSKQLKLLAFTCEVFDFADQDYLFHQGDASDCVYVILEGETEVVGQDADGMPVLLATSGANSLVGEMAAFAGGVRSAGVRARGAVSALSIPNQRFVELITTNPQVAMSVLQDLTRKLAETSKLVAKLQDEIETRKDN